MTLANRITIARIFLIPVFVGFAVAYGISLQEETPRQSWRLLAIVIFIVAAASDGLDGFIARYFNQRSWLGAILDPIADKALLLSAIIVLTASPWEIQFPVWFPILVIARDVVLISSIFLLNHFVEKVHVEPHWTGKIATVLQMIAIGLVMLNIESIPILYAAAAASIFTIISGLMYVSEGIRQLNDSDYVHPKSRS